MKRIRLSDFEQADYALARPHLAAMYRDGEGRTGIFASMHGYVRIYESVGRHRSTFMIFIHEGRTFSRDWKAVWGDKTLARLAREFVDEVVAA